MENEKFGFDMREDSDINPSIDLKSRSRDFFSFSKGLGQEKNKSFEFFENQNFLQNNRKSIENSNGKLDLQFNLDIGLSSSSSSDKLRSNSFDTFKNPERPFKKLDFSFDLDKTKEMFKSSELSTSGLKDANFDNEKPINMFNNKLLSKNIQGTSEQIENTFTEKPKIKSNFENLRNVQNKSELTDDTVKDKSNIIKKADSMSSLQTKPEKIQNIIIENTKINKTLDNIRNKPELSRKSWHTKPEVTKQTIPENKENINKPLENNKPAGFKKFEIENFKNNEIENKIPGKKQFLSKVDNEGPKRKNNISSPIPNSRVHFFSSANKSLRLTPAIRNESIGLSLKKEEINFNETLRKIEELEKRIQSIPRLGYDEVIENEYDILEFEEELPKAILRLVRLKWRQLECIISILGEKDLEFKDIISNFLEFEKTLTNSD